MNVNGPDDEVALAKVLLGDNPDGLLERVTLIADMLGVEGFISKPTEEGPAQDAEEITPKEGEL